MHIMNSVSQLNPLKPLHQAAEVEYVAWGAVDIVATFGESQAEYAFVRKSAGMIDLPQRGIIELTGKDRLPFLNNLLTNQTFAKAEKAGLRAGEGTYAFLLNLKGRIVCDVNVIERGDRTLLEIDARYAQPLVKLFDAYQFSEQVKVIDRTGQLHEIALHGPGAAAMISQLAGQEIALSKPLSSTSATLAGVETIVWRDDPTGLPGYHLILPADRAAEVWTTLLERINASLEIGKRLLRPLGWAMFNTLRIEAGRPIFGIDFDGQPVESAMPNKANRDAAADAGPGILPAETGLFDRAVSITKGCYLGQEIVARMHARQQLARQIVGIRLQTDALPFAGEPIYDDQNNQIGGITSSTISPLLSNNAICLGILKKQYIAPGTSVLVPAEGAMRKGTVVTLPFMEGVK